MGAMEQLRSVHVRLMVDTNKRTYTLDEECDSPEDAVMRAMEWVNELNL